MDAAEFCEFPRYDPIGCGCSPLPVIRKKCHTVQLLGYTILTLQSSRVDIHDVARPRQTWQPPDNHAKSHVWKGRQPAGLQTKHLANGSEL
jgi:hypothetical protein